MLKRLSKIDEKTKYGVYGWIREAEESLQLGHVPLMISSICILYFHEIFDAIGKYMKLSQGNKCITNASKAGGWNNTNYGIIEIASNTNATYEWELRVKEKGSKNSITVGITNTNEPDEYYGHKLEQYNHYMYNSSGSKWRHDQDWREYGDQYKKNDKVKMTLNLKNADLRFSVNDVSKGIAFENIEKGDDIKYRMFVSMYGENDSVEILNFSKK